MTTTLAEAISVFGVDVEDQHDRSSLIPTVRFVRQGDVIVIPDDKAKTATTPVTLDGIAVVRGENGGNTHMLLASGPVFFDASTARVASTASSLAQAEKQSLAMLELGTLTVPEGSTAYLAHPEHAYAGILPGTYKIRRQREQGEVEVRVVAD